MKIYNRDEFEIGMIIIATRGDNIYKITNDVAYEITAVFSRGKDLQINFINDLNEIQCKDINCPHAPFEEFFRIP